MSNRRRVQVGTRPPDEFGEAVGFGDAYFASEAGELVVAEALIVAYRWTLRCLLHQGG